VACDVSEIPTRSDLSHLHEIVLMEARAMARIAAEAGDDGTNDVIVSVTTWVWVCPVLASALAFGMAHGPLGSVQGEPAKRFRPDRRIRQVTSPQSLHTVEVAGSSPTAPTILR